MADAEDYTKEEQKQQLSAHIQLNIEEEARSLYADETTRRHAMSTAGRKILILAVILVVLLVTSLCFVPFGGLSFFNGNGFFYSLSPAEYRQVTVYRIGQLVDFITAGGSSTVQFVIYTQLAVMMAGMALSASGAAYQGVFQNPMASPTTLGVQSGGMLASVIYISFFYEDYLADAAGDVYKYVTGSELLEIMRDQGIFQLAGQQLFTLAGCFLGVVLIVGIALAAGRGKVNTVALILAGSVFSAVIEQIASLAQYVITTQGDEERVTAINNLVGGRFTIVDFTWYQVMFMAIPIVICLIFLFALGRRMNIMVFGADEAQAMGMNVTAFRNVIIACCTILTAVVLSFCGQISMLGFMMPHFARYLVGPDFRYLVPASTLLGGITTILIYDVCYLTGQTGRFNMYTSVICAVMSIFFILFYRRNRHADWS